MYSARLYSNSCLLILIIILNMAAIWVWSCTVQFHSAQNCQFDSYMYMCMWMTGSYWVTLTWLQLNLLCCSGYNQNSPLEDAAQAQSFSRFPPRHSPLEEATVTSGEYCEIDLNPGALDENENRHKYNVRRSPHGVRRTQCKYYPQFGVYTCTVHVATTCLNSVMQVVLQSLHVHVQRRSQGGLFRGVARGVPFF